MINTIFHFVNDPTFDYQTAVNNGDISEYTIVFNSADHSIHCKGTMFGRMSRADIAETLGNISDLIPVATDSTLGGIKIGYTNDTDQHSRRYGVVLDNNNKAYVEVPWSDTITPDYDDSAVRELIATERSRIDNFITTISSTIDAKNRLLFEDAQWVQDVFGIPQAEGSIWLQFENEIDHYLNEYMVWDWVDPNDHSKGRNAKISSVEQDINHITSRVGTTEERLDNAGGNNITIETFVSNITQTANDIDAHVGRVETKADANTGAIQSTNVALSDLDLSVNGFYKVELVSAPNPDTSVNISTISAQLSDRTTALANDEELNGKLFTTLPTKDVIYRKGSQYFKLNRIEGAIESVAGLTASLSEYKGNMDDLVTVVASTLLLKADKDDDGYISTSDLASVIANGRYNAYAGLNTTVLATYNNLSGLSEDVSGLAGDLSDLEDDFATLSSNVVLSSNLNTAVSQCTSFVNLSNTVNNITGLSTSQANLLATIDDNDWAGFMATVTKDSTTNPATYDTTAKVHANKIILDGTTFAGTIFSDLVSTTALQAGTATIDAATIDAATINSANITGTLNGVDGVFSGLLSAATGSFSGVVNATQFKAGDDSGFSITTSSDSLDFNYNGARLAFFSLRGWDSTNNQLADVPDNPTGFYLYLTNPLNGHLVTINFAELSFKDLNENQVLRHEATFYRLSNLNGKAVETPVKLYYSLENNTTKWWLHSDSTTELTSSEMGTLYKKQQVNQRGVSYGACVQEVDAGIPYITTGYTLYEEQTLQNNVPTKNGNYAMATYLNNDGSSSTDKWFVVPNSTTYLNNLNTNWSAVFRLSDGRVNETTATTVIQSSNRNTVPTFTFAVSFINSIDENGNVVSILYPGPSL